MVPRTEFHRVEQLANLQSKNYSKFKVFSNKNIKQSYKLNKTYIHFATHSFNKYLLWSTVCPLTMARDTEAFKKIKVLAIKDLELPFIKHSSRKL